MQDLKNKNNFDFNKSPIKDIYLLLGANSPGELSDKYTIEDQKIMKKNVWDYKNSDLIVNKIKLVLVKYKTLNSLTPDEVFWIRNILWSWYHHAISCAIWRYHNKKKAQEYSKKALEYQFGNHPNKITKLFYLLTHNKLREAEIWSDGIITEPEKTTAKYLVKEFKDKIIGLDFWINNKLL